MREALRKIIPASIRDPIGRWRRFAWDDLHRLVARRPYPSRAQLRNVQLTPFLEEYVEVGSASARVVTEFFTEAGLGRGAAVLDFGCGCARTLNFLPADLNWTLSGCDVDEEAIRWCSRALPHIRFRTSGNELPLPFPDDAFHAIYAISVFTHLDPGRQRIWFGELARVLRPEGLLLLTTIGPEAARSFGVPASEGERLELERKGVLFRPYGTAFNESGAFHLPHGIERLSDPWFRTERFEPLRLKGFHDVFLLRNVGR